jgi:hypothetical protein
LFVCRSQLPARATRLLNRRLQNTSNSPLSQNGSESPRSLDSLHNRNTPSKTSLRDHLKQRQQLNLQSQLLNSSSEDLVVDKTLRNSMLQDVSSFKKQLVHLRRILQEVSRGFFLVDVTPTRLLADNFSKLYFRLAISLVSKDVITVLVFLFHVVLLTFVFAFFVFIFMISSSIIPPQKKSDTKIFVLVFTHKKSQDEDNLMRVRCQHRYFMFSASFFPFSH